METIKRDTGEDEVLKDEVKRLRIELADAKKEVGGFHSDILMHSVLDSLLYQASNSLSTLISVQDKNSTPRNLDSDIKKY
jgi:hypothetical protein